MNDLLNDETSEVSEDFDEYAEPSELALPNFYTPDSDGVQTLEVGTAKDFANRVSPIIDSPDFFDLPFQDKHDKISDVYYSQRWDSDAQNLIKRTYQDIWNGSDDTPDIRQYAGVAPFVEKDEDPNTVLSSWRSNVINDLIDNGISPVTLGDKLETYLNEQTQAETDAYVARNRSLLGTIGNRTANYIRDIVKGGVSTVTKPIAGVERLLGFDEAANIAESTGDDILGTPAKDYLYETDENGYVKYNDDGTPVTKWQSSIAQGIGQAGTMLTGLGALQAAKGITAARTLGISTSTLTIANDSFRTVYESTGDRVKAYKAALFSLPAAAVNYLGDMSVISKFMNPAYKVLSDYNKTQLLARTMAKNFIIEGSTEAASDVLQQGAEIYQTGAEFNPERSIQAGVAGGVAGAVVTGGFDFVHANNLKASINKEKALKTAQDFQMSFNEDTVLDLPPDVYSKEDLDTLGLEIVENPDGPSRLVKKGTSLTASSATPEGFNESINAVSNTATPADLSAYATERGLLQGKENLNPTELDRLTELNTILSALDDGTYINSIKKEEAKIASVLQNDPGLLPNIRYEESTGKWINEETGVRADFLKDLVNPSTPSLVDTALDNTGVENLTVLDEEELVAPDEEAYKQAYDLKSLELREARKNKDDSVIVQVQRELTDLKNNFKEAKATYKKNIGKAAKISEKGLGAIITEGKKSEIVIPKGLTPETKESVMAHEVGHLASNNITLPENVRESVQNELRFLNELSKSEDVTTEDVAGRVLLPNVKKATKLPENSLFKNLDSRSKKALISEKEYLANQIGAEILRRQGVTVEGMEINPELAEYLKTVKLPDLRRKVSAEKVEAAQNTQDINIEDPKYSRPTELENPTVGEATRNPVNMFGLTGEEGETAWSQKVSEALPEREARTYMKVSNARTQADADNFINDLSDQEIQNILDNDISRYDLRTRTAILDAWLRKTDRDFENDPSPENARRFNLAENYRATLPTEIGQAMQQLKSSADEKTFPGFIARLKMSLDKAGVESNFTDFALKELKELHNKILRTDPNSVLRRDLENQAAQITLNSQGLKWVDWYSSYLRANPLSGLGTQGLNVLGGGALSALFIPFRHPTLLPFTLKMVGRIAPLARAEALRVWRGKSASEVFSSIADPRALSVQDYSTLPRKVVSKYNKLALKLARLNSAADTFFRSLLRGTYVAQNKYIDLKKQSGGDKAKFTSDVAKLMLPPEQINAATDKAYSEAKRAGVEITDADAKVRAYEILTLDNYSEDEITNANDWADVLSLRGEVANPFLKAIDSGLMAIVKSNPVGNLATSFVAPFARALIKLADINLDVVPIPGRLQVSDIIGNKIPSLKRSEAQRNRLIAGQKIGALVTASALGAALSNLIELTGEPEKVIDKTDDGEDSKGGRARKREDFKEFETMGKEPFSIYLKGSNTGFSYKDIPVLNGLLFGVLKAKQAIDKGDTPLNAASAFYLNSGFYYLPQFGGGSSLTAPYEKILNELTADSKEENYGNKVFNALQSFAEQAKNLNIPFSAAFRDIKRAYDETPEETYQEFFPKLFRDVPGLSEAFGSIPELDVFGKPKVRSGLERTPAVGRFINQRNDFDSPLFKAMADRGVGVPDIPAKIKITESDFKSTGVNQDKYITTRTDRVAKAYSDVFTPEERYNFQVATGPKIESMVQRLLTTNLDTPSLQKEIIKQTKAIRNASKKTYIRTGKFN